MQHLATWKPAGGDSAPTTPLETTRTLSLLVLQVSIALQLQFPVLVMEIDYIIMI